MKKIFLFILIATIVLVIIITMSIIGNNKNIQAIQEINAEYEAYLEKTIYGTDVATIINKAMDNNFKNGVEQDKERNFIQNDTNSLHVEIQFLYNEQTGETKTFSMEKVYYRGMREFIQPFSLTKFRIINIEYHEKTKRVKKLVFKQLEA